MGTYAYMARALPEEPGEEPDYLGMDARFCAAMIAAGYAPSGREPTGPLDAPEQVISAPIPKQNLSRIGTIKRLVARLYGVTSLDMVSKRHTPKEARARHIAMYLARKLTTHSYSEIGRLFGGMDHTTVLRAVGKIGKRVGNDRVLAEEIENIIKETLQ